MRKSEIVDTNKGFTNMKYQVGPVSPTVHFFEIVTHDQLTRPDISTFFLEISVDTSTYNRCIFIIRGAVGLYFPCSSTVCLLVQTKFHTVTFSDFYAIVVKWLLATLAHTIQKLVTLGKRSRPQ